MEGVEAGSEARAAGGPEAPASPVPLPFLGRSADRAIAVVLLVIALASALFALRLRLDPTQGSDIGSNPEMVQLEAAEKAFPAEHLLILALPCGDPWAPSSLDRLAALTDRLSLMAEGRSPSAAWRVYSPMTVSDLERQGDSLKPVILVGRGPAEQAASRSRLEASPLFRRLFLSGNQAWTIFLSVGKERGVSLSEIAALRRDFPELRVAGRSWISASLQYVLDSEFLPLLALASLILLAIQFRILGSFPTALLLWAFSLLPTLMLLALLVVLGQPLRVAWVLAPVMTLALSTSYITHLFRGWAIEGCDPRRALRSRAVIILLDAGTTVFGFASMLLSPVRELAFLGWICIAGALFSVFVILLGLPAVLGLAKERPRSALRFASEETGTASPPGHPRTRLLVLLLVALALAALCLRIGIGFRNTELFAPWSEKGREVAWFNANYEGLEEVTLMVSTGRENGIVDLAFWSALSDFEAALAALPGVSSTYAAPELVGELLARWDGRPGLVAPRSEREIGESLELLSGNADGIFARGFVNGDWSAVLVHLRLEPDFNVVGQLPRLRAEAAKAAGSILPGAKLSFSGDIVRFAIQQKAFMDGQIGGSFVFFLVLVLGLALIFRSPRKALLISIVPLMGFLAALGLMGLLGWRLSTENALCLAVIAGTGVDNAIVLVLRGWSKDARSASADSTLLIVAGLLPLLFCSAFLIVETTLLCAVGLVVSTLTTIHVLPAFGSVREPKGKNHA